MAQPSLEQYVAGRYSQELASTGYQPVCQNAEEMIEDALKIMALSQSGHAIYQAECLESACHRVTWRFENVKTSKKETVVKSRLFFQV